MPVPKGTPLDPAHTRTAILRTATRLLYQRGLDGIGVAELCATMGVSKETLYRHFGSKEELARAVLQARSDRILRWVHDAVAAAGDDPFDQLAAVFDALQRWHGEPTFRGCAILNAATQHHDGPARAVARQHLDRQLDVLIDIARRAAVTDPVSTAKQMLALRTGATILADHHGDADAARVAKEAALALLRTARSHTPRRGSDGTASTTTD
ncbi:TetR family transcriptional regulator [Micromonospora fulviviridis]|uniref:TetR/AcrR family transcriptional regulator n=1 Tax=Micromonospora fulviviridis TaxID=47860 RepID=UPI00166589FB|nr:TetR/AcrR family transcriptional regulator [Micromonospora fulviviridis]GGR99055.1 TetR family transcriptional regulator [Micromonospora fulviviridis]